MTTSPSESRPLRWLAVACFSLLLLVPACTFRDLADNVEEFDRLAVVRIRFLNPEGSGPGLVALLDAATKEVVNYAIVFGDSEGQIYAYPGEYFVVAFEDRNENFKRDAGETAASFGQPDLISIRPGETIPLLEIRIGNGGRPLPDALIDLDLRSAALGNFVVVGRVVELKDERFSAEHARMGMWKPWRFVNNRLLGLYLFEAYDPARIPVVFVHGIGGTPRDFEALIGGLDTSRYQPMVFFYPSALRLGDLGRCLFKAVHTLVLKYPRPANESAQVVLVAHSMGGLVARRAVDEYLRVGDLDYLRVFVTLASPLDGLRSAAVGVKLAPAVMPCWIDLAPGSKFLETLFARPLDDNLSYALFFAYGEGDGDGTVSLASQIRIDAQRQAHTMVGIDSDHVGILSDAETIRRLNELLAPVSE